MAMPAASVQEPSESDDATRAGHDATRTEEEDVFGEGDEEANRLAWEEVHRKQEELHEREV